MKAPRFRAGQLVNVVGHCAGEQFEDRFFVPCRIICPDENGDYLVRVSQTDGYSIIPEDSISSYPEYDPEKPADRHKIRIVFFGNGQFALPTLKMLVERGYDVAAVVTMIDNPCGHGNKMRQSPVKIYAESIGIPVYEPPYLKSKSFLNDMSNLNLTLGVVVEYRILPPELFLIPRWGIINLHSSLLPMYRGASTITSAIKDGSTMTGVTTFFIDRGIDTGRIINNLGIYIGPEESAEDVHVRLRSFGADMVDDAIQRIAHSCNGIPQSDLVCDFIRPCYAPKLRREDAIIPWCDSAEHVFNFIRAHSSVIDGHNYPKSPAIAGSVPTAWTAFQMIDADSHADVKIHKASITDIPRGFRAPGEWFGEHGRVMVACKDRLLSIDILQLPGKKRMTAREYLNGLRGVCKGFCKLTQKDQETVTENE